MIKNTDFSLKILAVRLLTATFIISSVPTQTRAQLTPGYQVSIKFPDTQSRGAPERTGGAGRRDVCDLNAIKTQSTLENTKQNKIELTAVTPTNNVITTVSPNPAVYVYVAQTTDKKAEFRIIDRESKTNPLVYTKTFSLPNTSGIVKMNIPENIKLQTGKTYAWQLLVICNSNDRKKDKDVAGFVERANLNAEQIKKIEQVKQKPLEQAKLYAEFGIWYEALAIIESLRDNPQTKKEWNELLESINLQQLANFPVSNCCQVTNSPTISANTNKTQNPQPPSTLNNKLRGNL